MIFSAFLLCPWINAATAAAFVGRPVMQTGCDFKGQRELRIEVISEYKPRCTPMKAIGSEAFICPGEVVFRVRDRVCRITLKPDDPEKLRKVAEMIAGSMF